MSIILPVRRQRKGRLPAEAPDPRRGVRCHRAGISDPPHQPIRPLSPPRAHWPTAVAPAPQNGVVNSRISGASACWQRGEKVWSPTAFTESPNRTREPETVIALEHSKRRQVPEFTPDTVHESIQNGLLSPRRAYSSPAAAKARELQLPHPRVSSLSSWLPRPTQGSTKEETHHIADSNAVTRANREPEVARLIPFSRRDNGVDSGLMSCYQSSPLVTRERRHAYSETSVAASKSGSRQSSFFRRREEARAAKVLQRAATLCSCLSQPSHICRKPGCDQLPQPHSHYCCNEHKKTVQFEVEGSRATFVKAKSFPS